MLLNLWFIGSGRWCGRIFGFDFGGSDAFSMFHGEHLATEAIQEKSVVHNFVLRDGSVHDRLRLFHIEHQKWRSQRLLGKFQDEGTTHLVCVWFRFKFHFQSYRHAKRWFQCSQVPVLCLLLYVCTSMVGMLTIPWTMTAELFPTEIRGIAHSISYSMANVLMFAALQSYRSLQAFLGGTRHSLYLIIIIY